MSRPEAGDSCSYDEQEDDRELTLGNFLWAQMAAERHSHEGWRTREICAERGELMGPGDLEERIARVDAPLDRRWLQYHSLAVRYRHLLEQVIDMYGGTDRVWRHLQHLQECHRHGTPPGPLPPLVNVEELQQTAALAMWRALTMGLA